MEKRVAIIGAGLSGLLACKYILNKGFKPTVFEEEARIGGVWAKTMESTRLQNIREGYQFSDFPWPSTVKDLHPNHIQVIEYLEAYADFFKILPCIKFNSKVIGIDYVGESFQEMESWDLWGGNGKAFGSKGKWHIKVQETNNCRLEEYHFEFLILCIGRFSGYPNIPEFPPNKGPEVFKGKVKHSMDFSALDNATVANFVEGKKVAVIGSHKSAVDIAAECASTNGVKYPCTVVQRTAHWFLPSTFFSGLLLGFLYANRFSELLVHKPGETFRLALLATLLSPLVTFISYI
ncbi:probable flavin-containing monooxygenase 1 [Jatropha curcas]|uniref:probable flavin-containing monooxygenase 1 n=1 Tax=Jatropha curcas TaxID=180498 RepID=UPI00189431B0|nr:probable flavin-containing monooxygenase 1 [Jatropha curcas]